ncbi:MAG: putative bifunctional diguanylate cyclase/phosphodiesterase, partial [Burkholderiaceae bacterium]
DITERKEAENKIQSLAYYDNVTSLPNRVLLNDRLDQAIHMATRSAKKVGLLFLDLDNFKNVNDSLGHQIGDNLLHSVGRRLLGCVREEDTVARIGGDEFMVLLPDLDRGEEARRVAEKIIATFAKPFLLQDHQIYTTTSIGISLFPNDSKQVPDLIKFADSALYEAKSHGRNNYQFFTQELNDQITRDSKIERRLRHAMEVGELSLWYQPQIDVRDGKVIGAEALLRWRDGNPDLFMPAEFIAVAEERGLITKLGEWTIREACKQCRLWQTKGLRIVPIAVNVSPIQLQQKEFAELVLAILRDSGLDASFLELEITETSIMRSAQMVAALAVRLRDSGVRISIDDFGTGYSSFSFLKHIPIDKIKIDRSFIRDMLSDAEDETITQAIVSLGKSLQLRVIAEGVESQAQMERLLYLGCHEAQGFYYSHAVSSEVFQNFLEKGWHFTAAVEPEPV